MTCAVIVPSLDGPVFAVDRRLSDGNTHLDQRCAKAFVRPNLKIAAAGSVQKFQLLYSRLRNHAVAEQVASDPFAFFPEYYADNEYTDNDSGVQFLVMVGDTSWYVSGAGDVIERPRGAVWSMGSGGDYVRGFLEGRLPDPLNYDTREFVLHEVQEAFKRCPFDGVSPEIDVL